MRDEIINKANEVLIRCPAVIAFNILQMLILYRSYSPFLVGHSLLLGNWFLNCSLLLLHGAYTNSSLPLKIQAPFLPNTTHRWPLIHLTKELMSDNMSSLNSPPLDLKISHNLILLLSPCYCLRKHTSYACQDHASNFIIFSYPLWDFHFFCLLNVSLSTSPLTLA